MDKFSICFTIEMGVTKWSDAKSVLRIQQKVSSDVIEHDRILTTEELIEFSPDNCQWLNLWNKKISGLKNWFTQVID